MTTIASQITSLTSVYSTVYSDADQRKHQSSASLAFVWGIHRDRWIPRTKGQLRGKCFHLMTSSWRGSFATCFRVYSDVFVVQYTPKRVHMISDLLRFVVDRCQPVFLDTLNDYFAGTGAIVTRAGRSKLAWASASGLGCFLCEIV